VPQANMESSSRLRPPQSTQSSTAASPVMSSDDDFARARVSPRTSHGDFSNVAIDAQQLALLDENADLKDRLSRSQRKLHRAKSEAKSLREKVFEYEAKERLAAAVEDACCECGASKARGKRTVAVRLNLVKHCQHNLEPPQEDLHMEEQLSFHQQLSDLETRYTAASRESASLRTELVEVEQLGQSLLMDVEEAREVVQETQQTLDTERMLLKEAQDEARRLRNELNSLKGDDENRKVVLRHRSSLGLNRRKQKFVTANLLSQMETWSDTSEEAGWDTAVKKSPDQAMPNSASGENDMGDVTSISSIAGTIVDDEQDAGDSLRRRSCELVDELEEARLAKERLQRHVDDLQHRLEQMEARLRQEQTTSARQKSRELLEARDSEGAMELQEASQTEALLRRMVKDLEQRLILMERIATDWKRRAQTSQESWWQRTGMSFWSSSLCSTACVGLPAAHVPGSAAVSGGAVNLGRPT